MPKPSPYETAPAAFARNLAEIERLRAALDAEIEEMKEAHADKPSDWRIIGDAAHLVDSLRRAIGADEGEEE